MALNRTVFCSCLPFKHFQAQSSFRRGKIAHTTTRVERGRRNLGSSLMNPSKKGALLQAGSGSWRNFIHVSTEIALLAPLLRYKTRHDKTRQGKTRQGKTRQDKTRQDKTRQDKTRLDKARQGKAKPDKTRQDNHKTTTRQPQDNHKANTRQPEQEQPPSTSSVCVCLVVILWLSCGYLVVVLSCLVWLCLASLYLVSYLMVLLSRSCYSVLVLSCLGLSCLVLAFLVLS
jgi:hypothetical protein